MKAVIPKQRDDSIGAEIGFEYCAIFNHFEDKNSDGVSLKNFYDAPNF